MYIRAARRGTVAAERLQLPPELVLAEVQEPASSASLTPFLFMTHCMRKTHDRYIDMNTQIRTKGLIEAANDKYTYIRKDQYIKHEACM